MDPCRIFAGNASQQLAQLDLRASSRCRSATPTCRASRTAKSRCEFNENIRGSDVFIVQATGAPADNLMELLVMLDAAKRASARRVTAVMPYFGYARQDRKDQPRAPISAKLVANLITVAGADRALTMDLHSAQIQGFFDIPFDHLYAAPVLIEYFAQKNIPDLVVVAPDIGSVKMARAYAKRLGAELALVDKRRPRADAVEIMNIIGDVEGQERRAVRRRGDDGAHAVPGRRGDPRAGRQGHLRRRHARRVQPGARSSASPKSPIKELVITDTRQPRASAAARPTSSSCRWPACWARPCSASTRSVR